MSILILSKVMQYQKFYLLHYKDQGSNSLDVHKDWIKFCTAQRVFPCRILPRYQGPFVWAFSDETIKVRSLDASTFKLEYWRGTWRKEWKPWELSNGDIWTDTLPKSCRLLVHFVLDGKSKLPHETYKYLKETYQTLRERNLSQW